MEIKIWKISMKMAKFRSWKTLRSHGISKAQESMIPAGRKKIERS